MSTKINSSCVIMIFGTTLFYKALILHGEIWCWSLLGLNGLKGLCHGWLIHFVYRCQLRVIFAMILGKLLLNGKIIALLYQTNMPCKHNIKHYKQQKWTLNVHLYFILYLPCHLYLLWTIWVVIFMFHSIWWQFQLFEFW